MEQGQSAILDGSFKRQSERLSLMDLAEKTGARIQFIECRASLKIIHRRLEQRSLQPKAVSDGRWEIFNQQRKDFDPIVDPVRPKCFRVKTIRPFEYIIKQLHLMTSQKIT